MNKLIKHIRRWNLWRKNCMNSKLHKILVLFGVIKSPTMATIFLPEEVGTWSYRDVTSDQIISELRILLGKEQ